VASERLSVNAGCDDAICWQLTGGPLAFLAGERLGAVSFLPPRVSHLLQGLCWSVARPLLVYFTDCLFGSDRTKCFYPWLRRCN